MKPLVEVKLPYRREEIPLAQGLLAAGAERCVLLEEGELNRATVPERNNSQPPQPAALERIGAICRATAKNGMGPGPVHALLHLEIPPPGLYVPPLRDQVTGARALRASLAPSAAVSLGMFPSWYTPADEAWADAAAVVDALCWGFYPWNEVIRQGKEYWLGEIRSASMWLKTWFPRRRKRIAYVTPFLQVWWKDQPQYADIADQDGRAVRVDWWGEAMVELRDGGWQPLLWGPDSLFDPSLVVEHLRVAAEVFGLMWSEPAVVVPAGGVS